MVFFLFSSTAFTQVITTVAGNGVGGYTGDGVPATTTSLLLPGAVAVDSQNNLFIADTYNSRVRKVDATTSIITTVAGISTSGYSGDGGPAIAAQLYDPAGLAFDSNGNLFIADYFNHAVRKITVATGIITTIAGNGTTGYSGDGGLATLAQLSTPSGVAVDSKGDIYISDLGNRVLRRVDGATGIITTFAGTGALGYSGDGGPANLATFGFNLDGVAMDAHGNIYAVDGGNDVIRKIQASTGIITTFAGNGTPGFSGDGGAATLAQFNYPGSISFDQVGNAYISDEVPNERVRRVDSSGIVTTVVGNGTLGFCGDGGPPLSACLAHPEDTVTDSLGNFYIADLANNRIRKVVGLAIVYTSTPTVTASVTPSFTPAFTATPTVTFTATYSPTSAPTCVPQVWPDPFNPKYAKDGVLKIGCVPAGASVSIYTLSGEAVWGSGQSSFQYGSPDTATWEGTNQDGVPVSPGVYYYAIQQGSQLLQRGKFLVAKGN